MANEAERKGGLLSDRHIVGAFVLGLTMVLAGFLAEAFLPPMFTALGNLWHIMAGEGLPLTGGDRHDGAHDLGAIALIVLLLKELGVAFLVAAIIGYALEKQAKERDNERAMQLRADVANDAVFALYGLRHRRAFVKAVVETNLEQRIVRERMFLKYSLRALRESEARTISPHRHEDALQRFVVLEMESQYVFRNVSAGREDVKVRYAVPTRQGAGARSLTRAHFVRIGEATLGEEEIRRAIQSDGDGELEYCWERSLAPNGELPVLISVTCVKERSDNEVWGSFYPTVDGVTLSFSVLEGMRFGVRPLSSANLIEQPTVPNPFARTWRFDGPLLKHNSAVFWWRTPEDDGEEVDSKPVEFSPPEEIREDSPAAEPSGVEGAPEAPPL